MKNVIEIEIDRGFEIVYYPYEDMREFACILLGYPDSITTYGTEATLAIL